MKVQATVLTSPTSDTPGTAVMVHFDDKRYIFGQIAEGSQRAFVERRIRLAKVQDIFLTGRTEWATAGGIVGFLLTVGDSRAGDEMRPDGSPVVLHGGDNLLQTIAATRSFVFRGQLKVKVDEIEEEREGESVFRDENVVIRTLHIHPSSHGPESSGRKRPADEMVTGGYRERVDQLKEVVDTMFASQKNVNKNNELEDVDPLITGEAARGKRSKTSSEDEGRGRPAVASRQYTERKESQYPNPLPRSIPSPVALSYTVITHDHRGKFLPGIATELGVPKGHKFGLLANGHSVMTPSGRLVEPHEVLEPTILGTGIAVCDLPEADYVANFVSHPEWSDIPAIQAKVGCFFWILGPGIVHDSRIIDFMKRFSGSKHIVASQDVCANYISFGGAAKFATKLNHLDPVYFPQLHSCSTAAADVPEPALAAEPGLIFTIKPTWGLERKLLGDGFDPVKALSAEEAGTDFLSIAIDTRESLAQSPPEVGNFPGSDVQVYTLGTGSALPSRYRNVTAIFVIIPGNCSIFLDCGEGTVGQMKRVFGPEGFNKHLLETKVLYISHLHADHHLGSISLLKAQHQLLHECGDGNRPTYVVAPNRFWTWLTDYSSVEDFGIDRLVYVSNEQLRHSTTANFSPSSQYKQLVQDLKLTCWITAPALHCQSSFTTALTFESGFKLAYSGDTRPTGSFVDIGKEATLLVHEATFDDELIDEAIAKKHSTIGEAIKVGKDMKARKTALVHFSQRYPKAPTFEGDNDGDVVYGFDYMRFKVGEVNRFQRLVKGVAEVYKEAEEGKNVD